jgi:MinD-like ATPase involved in chromosome partitioning or flagellar assembly
MLEFPILGMVPEDKAMQKALSLRDAVVHTHPTSKAARAYKEIAAKLIGVEYNSKKDKPTFFRWILKKEDKTKVKKFLKRE